MEIEWHKVPESTIQEFADRNGLVMEIHERGSWLLDLPHIGENGRYYAKFKGADIKEDHVLRSAFGNGSLPELAIENYAREISETLLVIDAYSESRREIRVPRLIK